MRFFKFLGHLIIIAFLTILTQIGGLIWLLSISISIKFNKKKRLLFPVLYLVFNLLIVPPIAKSFGREPLPIFSSELKPRNWVYPLLFRNYANQDLKLLLENTAKNLKDKHISITYLDANFPFLNGFPLLPHLSHSDGKKVDISFIYLNKNGETTDKKPSVSGYGVYVHPSSNTLKSCINNGYWQYDSTKYLTFGTINNLELDNKSTKLLIKKLLSSPKTEKIFIEPYLKKRLDLSSEQKIRFHGCRAVRHDDHIHLQIK